MNKMTKSFLALCALATLLSADPMVTNQNFDDDFKKMNAYINAMVKSHLNTQYFNDMGFPKADMSQNKDSYTLKFDMAGIAKEDIKLSIDQNNILTLEGERKSEKEEKDKSFVRQEMYYGKFKRSMQLPEDADQEKLSSEYKNGILTVTLGKKEIIKPTAKIIPIQ